MVALCPDRYDMRNIELRNGYMVCTICRGYIEAGNQTPECECIDATVPESIPASLN